jgi:TetR/AcrR family transcriptional repressor of nem operon
MGKGEQTREHILEKASVLFNRQGFAGASLADIMEATGLQKGGIYRHFESKEALALEAFDHALARIRRRFEQALEGRRHAIERLHAVVDVIRDNFTRPHVEGGCPVMNTAIENDDGNPELRARALQAMDDWAAMIRRIVERGAERGEVRPGTDPDEVATLVIALLEGAIMLSSLHRDPVHVQRAVAHLERHFERELRAA